MAHLTIIRGIPGSGKSTLASIICQSTGAVHFEADMFFTDESGVYKYIPDDIPKAHDWCQKAVHSALLRKHDVVVSNCFVKYAQILPYLGMPYTTISLIECSSEFRSIHNVPIKSIQRMRAQWEPFRL